MRVWTILGIAAAALMLGCEPIKTDSSAPVTPPASTDSTGAPTTAAPDNTRVNRRDAEPSATKTPIDQNENQDDINRTAEIRKRILDTPDMSVNARNAKIITANGKVTLRGPVNSEAERDAIVKIATAVAGEGNVDNQLEIKAANP